MAPSLFFTNRIYAAMFEVPDRDTHTDFILFIIAVERTLLKATISTFLTMDGSLRAFSARIDEPREDAVGR